ncbi:MAG: cytochrome c peroxidase [Bacteriovoracaceae bacterium]|nr:c-type cytochrome [Bacteroidota bacterium]
MTTPIQSTTQSLQFILLLSVLFLMAGCGENHTSQSGKYSLTLPLGLDSTAQYIPADNPMTAAKIELGRKLFFDARLSLDGTVSCATCHNPSLGFSDGRARAMGIYGQEFKRSAPTLINRLFSKDQFWDGRVKSLEEQAPQPIQNELEMRNTPENVERTLKASGEYQEDFQQVFGTDVSMDGIAKAIAAFERTLVSGNSPYDKFKAGETTALTESARRGLTLFESDRVNCVKCHTGFNFTDEKFHNNGTGQDQPQPDLGRFEQTKNDSDRGVFKTPTLRDMSRTAPYMHDGSLRTLMDVINFYNKGGIPNQHLSKHMRPLNLTEEQRTDLVAFLRALSGTNTLDF